MLVVVDRNGAPIFLEDICALLKEFVARIKNLALFIARIISVLANNKDSVHCELVTAAAKGLGDGWIHRKSEFLGAFSAEVSGRLLIDVQRNDLHVRPMPCSPHRVTY